MKKLLLPIFLFATLTATAQTTIKRDDNISQMVNEVSSQNIEAIIRKLVSFKSRHTLSDTTGKTTGSALRATGSRANMSDTRSNRTGGWWCSSIRLHNQKASGWTSPSS